MPSSPGRWYESNVCNINILTSIKNDGRLQMCSLGGIPSYNETEEVILGLCEHSIGKSFKMSVNINLFTT